MILLVFTLLDNKQFNALFCKIISSPYCIYQKDNGSKGLYTTILLRKNMSIYAKNDFKHSAKRMNFVCTKICYINIPKIFRPFSNCISIVSLIFVIPIYIFLFNYYFLPYLIELVCSIVASSPFIPRLLSIYFS